MTMVVTEPCIDCVHAECIHVCPVDAFYRGSNMLVIHPDECTECQACVDACPAEAIFHEDDVPEPWKRFIALNRDYAEQWPSAVDA